MKLMIVDDNEGVRRLIRSIVLPYASKTCECADGMDALPVYCAERPDLVLMDIRMNKVDGIQATKQIRKAYPEAKVLIVTDYDDDRLRREATNAGASDYILKDNLLELLPWLAAP